MVFFLPEEIKANDTLALEATFHYYSERVFIDSGVTFIALNSEN
eukprot:gene2732-13532_t